jgi:hypothetical protein
LNIGFYKIHEEKPVSLFLYKFSAQGDASDSIMAGSSISKVSLPLSNSRDSSMYIFKFTITDTTLVSDTTEFADTVCFRYTRILSLLSYNCGFMYDYKLLNIESTRNIIDSVAIIKSSITTTNEENLRILF